MATDDISQLFQDLRLFSRQPTVQSRHDVFKSEMLTFIVGESAERILVHSEAISRLSPSLKALVKGPMRESQEKTVIWNDVDPADFSRFCQFAYAGDYEPAEPAKDDVESAPRRVVEQAIDTTKVMPPSPSFKHMSPSPPLDQACTPTSIHHGGRLFPEELLQKVFRDTRYHDEDTILQLRSSYQTPADQWPNRNFAPVLLSHARLYVLGDKYGVTGLTSLATHKLHETLKARKLSLKRTGDVVQLARYIYEHTPPAMFDPMRYMVSDYIRSEINTVRKSSEFRSLLEEGGDFVVDFWKLLEKDLFPKTFHKSVTDKGDVQKGK